MRIQLARYTSPFSNPWAVIGETLMLPALAVGIGIWVNPLDPLWIGGSFPWVWLAPMLLALRYGPFPGLAAATLLFLGWLFFNDTAWIGGEFPKLFFLGGLITVMLCGEFSSLWVARARRAETTQAYLDQRLEFVTHQYYLLRLSHDRLEQDMISRPMSMRDALTTLRGLTLAKDGPLPGADGLLRLFAQYCQLEVAALYLAQGEALVASPVASLGQPAPLDRADPLLVRALENDALWHVQSLQAGGPDTTPSRYLIVAPLTTLDGVRHGVLTVERLPFFALHQEMLQTLNLMLSYYTDGLAMRHLAARIQAIWPDCPVEFASELERLHRVARDSTIPSLIVALEFSHDAAGKAINDMAFAIQRQKRLLDVNWLIESPARTVLVTLMPLAGDAAAEGYFARIDQLVRQQSAASMLDAGIFPHRKLVDAAPAAEQLTQLLAFCHVVPEARPLRVPA